jgi:hypothetical protein
MTNTEQPMTSSVLKKTLAGTGCAGLAGLMLAATLSGLTADGVVAAANTAAGGLRGIFMNGTDISGARNQFLKNVDVQIAENGDIFIIAPHYQVSEEDAYTPLSRFVQGINAPAHRPPQKGTPGVQEGMPITHQAAPQPVKQLPAGQPAELQKADATQDAPGDDQPITKAGTPAGASTIPASVEKSEDPPPALPE